MRKIAIAYQNSLSRMVFERLDFWFKQSYLYKIPTLISEYIIFLYHNSFFKKYIHSNHSFFSYFFKEGMFYFLISQLFVFMNWILTVFTNFTKGSYSEKITHLLRLDANENIISFGSSFLFSALGTFFLLQLIFGSGYNRSQMLVMFPLIFLLYFLSQLKGKAEDYWSNSVLLKWIQNIYR